MWEYEQLGDNGEYVYITCWIVQVQEYFYEKNSFTQRVNEKKSLVYIQIYLIF